jgi:DNA-binding MarR family transcriptional regulator
MNENYANESEEKILVLKKLVHAASLVEARVETALGGTGLSISKYAALDRLIKASEPLLLTRLAEQLSCVKSNITQLVDRLEADGFVARKDDPQDRRSILATITDEGRRRYETGDRILAATAEDLLKPFEKDELVVLNNLLDRFDKD